MSQVILFPSLDQILNLHSESIRRFGGSNGIIDRGLLESAVAQPEAMFGGVYLHEFPAGMAAAYLFHICKNHPFIDGNKRTALATADVFLRLNDFELSATNAEIVRVTLAIADGTMTKDELIAYFKLVLSPTQ